jgi:spore coat protein H
MPQFILLLLFSIAAFADDFADSQVLFDDSQLLTVEVTMPPDSFAWLLAEENLNSDRYLMAAVRLLSSEIDTTADSVGFRVRGNTSRQSAKKSFKIAFDAFDVEEDRVFGLKKMNLNGEHNDPSVIRSKLCWDLFDQIAAPACRAAHAKLYVNGEYRGLYVHVEEYDKTFLRSRFGDDSGNLYKCLWPADLTYRGSDPEAYKFIEGGRRTYELQTNEAEDDYSDIAHLIDVINNTPDAQFEDSLEANFNTWGFLKMLAVEVLVGQWDNYWYNKNNYFLYHDQITGKFEFMPYDLDNTFGIWWDGIEGGRDWGNENIYDWGNRHEPRPLVDRMLAVPQYRALYTYFIDRLLEESFNVAHLFAEIETLLPIISPAAETDFFRTLDYGWSYQDFLNSYSMPLGDHVPYGLRPYITTRYTTAGQQTTQDAISPVFLSAPSVSLSLNPMQLNVDANIFDNGQLEEVAFHRVIDETEVIVPLEFLETRYDGIIAYSYCRARIDLDNPGAVIRYYLEAVDNSGHVTTYPRNAPDNLFEYQIFGLLINEIMASNDTTIEDEFGESDDWIELYNGSDSTMQLVNWALTDDPREPSKWILPDTTILANDFLLLWLDDDEEEQGILHGPFNLNRDGEFLGLYHRDGENYTAVDTLRFGYQETDISWGRSPDGSANWVSMSPTPEAPNLLVSVDESNPVIAANHLLMSVYPNPFNPSTTISFTLTQQTEVSLAVYNLLGRLEYSKDFGKLSMGGHSYTFDASHLPSGMYLGRLTAGQQCLTRKLLLLR